MRSAQRRAAKPLIDGAMMRLRAQILGGSPGLGQLRNNDSARIATRMFQLHAYTRPIAAERKALGPLDHHDPWLRKRVVERERFQIVEVFHAIKVHVIDLRRIGVGSKDVY